MVKTMYSGMMFHNDLGYCSDKTDKFYGCVFAKHPDGQWVMLFKIPDLPLPVDKAKSKITCPICFSDRMYKSIYYNQHICGDCHTKSAF